MTHNLKPFPATGLQGYRETYEALVFDDVDPKRAIDRLLRTIARDRRKAGLDLTDAEAARIRQRLLDEVAAEKARLDAEEALFDREAEVVSLADARAGLWQPKPKDRPEPPHDTGGPQAA